MLKLFAKQLCLITVSGGHTFHVNVDDTETEDHGYQLLMMNGSLMVAKCRENVDHGS